MIHETIITTRNLDGSPHLAPMGVHEQEGMLIVAPFRPSTTLENLQREKTAVINMTDDVRIFAGCLTGHRDWPIIPVTHVRGVRLQAALSHIEVVVDHCDEDNTRPVFHCVVKYRETHAPFNGFNRAQAAVIEASILASRVHMLTPGKIEDEMRYLQIAIDKTAGDREKQAWAWLVEYFKKSEIPVTKEEAV